MGKTKHIVPAVAWAFAGPWEQGPGWGMYPSGPSDLDLTAEQSTKLQALREAYLKDVTPLRNQLFSKRAELRLLWTEPNPDQDKIVAKQKEMLEIQSQLEERSTAFRLETRKVLTPEQWAQLSTSGHGMERRGHMGRWYVRIQGGQCAALSLQIPTKDCDIENRSYAARRLVGHRGGR
jgi:Spy/CpxP family protein refolding chaperone